MYKDSLMHHQGGNNASTFDKMTNHNDKRLHRQPIFDGLHQNEMLKNDGHPDGVAPNCGFESFIAQGF